MDPIAVYIHTPFCPSKCGYCDFNSYAMSGSIMERTTAAICSEIRQSPWKGIPSKTIFFGGGTPTFLPEDQLLAILDAVVSIHPPVPDCEITSESNPGTADAEKYKNMRLAGFNRLSLGAQSFQDADLIRLERVHQSSEIYRAVDLAKNAGFNNINLDLMFALPSQSLIAWNRNLTTALEIRPDHLSLYCLTIEPNTTFYKQHLRGQLALPDDEVQVEMYEDCLSRLEKSGYKQYEISNFALPGKECRHNLCYWHNEPYASYGPGAVGCMEGVRYTNLKHPAGYCDAVESGSKLQFEQEQLSDDTRKVEQIMLGLRLNEGIGLELLEGRSLDRLKSLGWIESDSDRVRLSRLGRHFCSEVALELI